MTVWCLDLVLFAQQPEQPPAPGGSLLSLLPMFLAIAFLFYFMLIRPQKREQARRDQLLGAIKKNDRVVTVGGIIGTVANLSQDGKEATLKVDDNTRIRILRSHIQSVMLSEGSDEASSQGS